MRQTNPEFTTTLPASLRAPSNAPRHSWLRAGAALLACWGATALTSCKPAASPAAAEQPTEAAATPPAATEESEYQGTVAPELREKPPESGPAPEWRFPQIHHSELANGLDVHVIQRQSLPIVELRLVVLSGQGTDGNKPGRAVVAGELLKAGGTGKLSSRQTLDKIESLGSSLHILTDKDTTRLSLAVTRDHFEEALDLLAQVAQKPAFDAGEFKKLKTREMDRVASAAKASASWSASMVLYRELFQLPTATHPYAAYDATSEQIAKLSLWDCQSWHRSHFTPKNALLMVAGDVTAEQVSGAAKQSFGGWKGKAPPKPSFTTPPPPDETKIHLVHRESSPQAEIRVAVLGPERTSADWAATKVADQVLGGGVAGRLFNDVREKRSLAYSTYSSIRTVANGPSPIILSAGTQTAKAGQSLQALLEHLELISAQAATPTETAIATRYLSDVFLLQMETAGAVADLAIGLSLHGLPDDYYDKYRAEVRQTTAEAALAAARKYFVPKHAVVVVAGDADRLATPLSHFGEVHVIDPQKEFKEVRVVPHDPNAKIELEREEGT